MRSTLGAVFKKRFFRRSLRIGQKHSSLFGPLVSFEAKKSLVNEAPGVDFSKPNFCVNFLPLL
jgi:hypothetical protein